MNDFRPERFPFLRLVGLSLAAFLIHGYHLGVEDAEIYIPAARHFLNPNLYPFAQEFFLSHGHLSLFGPLLAGTAALTRLSMDWTFILWHWISIFATLAASWLLVNVCFSTARAKWSALMILAAVLTMPATNTGLLLIDPYLTARSFSTPLTLFVLSCALERRYARASAGLALTAAFHPQMVVYLISVIGIMWVKELRKSTVEEPMPVLTAAFMMSPMGFHLAPAAGAYREALLSRDYFFLYNWTWYDWLGMVAPLAILFWFWKNELRGTRPALRQMSFALVVLGIISVLIAALFSSSPAFEMFARLQPLRTFHLITLVFVIFTAGVFGEYAGRDRAWVAPALAIPLALGMFCVDRMNYPNSPHIEFPGRTSTNPWINTLLWIRQNTPTNAVFALDSRYFVKPPVDEHGFRAISERSALADYHKDGGVVCLFPSLADEWKQMSNATYGLDHFSVAEFRWLKQEYPAVSWVVIRGRAPEGMNCPHRQDPYSVCQMP
jgi:hypothetical protein